MRGRRLTQSKKLSKLAVATDVHAATKTARPNGHKKSLVIVLLCVFVVASGVLLLQRSNRQTTAPEETTTDVTVLVGQAKEKLATNSSEEMESYVNEIVATKGYDANQDALYVVVVYYIKTSNAPKAREYLDKLMLI
jgi:cytoskeletal protein RodZ